MVQKKNKAIQNAQRGRPITGRKIKPVSSGVSTETYEWLIAISQQEERSLRYVARQIFDAARKAANGRPVDLKALVAGIATATIRDTH